MNRSVLRFLKDYQDAHDGSGYGLDSNALRGLITESRDEDEERTNASNEVWQKKGSRPTKLMKSYRFAEYADLVFFMEELFEYQAEANHHGKLTIDGDMITVEVYTRDLDDITELDHEYAQAADLIFADITNSKIVTVIS